MPTPFTLSGSLALPPDTGQPIGQIPFSGSASFESKADLEFNITGAGTQVVPFGSVGAPGAKGILVEVDASSNGAPVQLRFNAGDADGQLEVAPGGFLAFFSPVPATGITALSIVSTTANRVRVRVLG